MTVAAVSASERAVISIIRPLLRALSARERGWVIPVCIPVHTYAVVSARCERRKEEGTLPPRRATGSSVSSNLPPSKTRDALAHATSCRYVVPVYTAV